jgi:hypothetical protein
MFKTAAPCSVFREHVTLNPASFSTVAQADSDHWRETANLNVGGGSLARALHQPDATAYPAAPIEDSWTARLGGSGSVANTAGSQRGGNNT